MTIGESLLPEFDREMASTRRVLERVPEEKFDWQPHAKSMQMGHLAMHLANLASWVTTMFATDSLDLGSAGGQANASGSRTREEVLAAFDEAGTAARATLATASDEAMQQPWTLISHGHTVFSLPRVVLMRSFVLNHLIHHRAQLGLYLRLNDVPVPSVYGPTADEGR